ncbi:Formate/nitrite transporter [Auriculariales sp. MPI-PUGE-AT-0066]|nr:Formate/nitrite transporter [Auriculariales sp. MPI-PUGE-AT-0066]
MQVNAGVLLSSGGMLSMVLSAGSPGIAQSNPGLVSGNSQVMSGFVFPVGLVMIVLQGQELLTSNMMTFPMAVLTRALPWWSLPVNWFIVFWGNLAGSLFFAAVLARYTDLLTHEPYVTYLHHYVQKKAVDPNWLQINLRAIGCTWLVSIAVWQGLSAKEVISKVVAIWFPIWIFVACSFDHVVANMFSLPLGMMLDADLTPAEYIKKSLFASFFGNITGALCVALPAFYFYLHDYTPARVLAQRAEKVEEGTASAGSGSTESTSAMQSGTMTRTTSVARGLF